MSYFRAKRPKWVPGVSDFEGPVPIPRESVEVAEIGLDHNLKSSILKPDLICPITLSMGILSGNLLLSGTGRATLALSGYVMPFSDSAIVYH